MEKKLELHEPKTRNKFCVRPPSAKTPAAAEGCQLGIGYPKYNDKTQQKAIIHTQFPSPFRTLPIFK